MSNSYKYPVILKDNIKVITAFILCLGFLIISLLMIENGGSYLWLLPPALFTVFLAFIAIDRILILTVLLVPLSIQLRFIVPEASADLFLPTELMLAGILVLMIFKLFIWKEIDTAILRHPVSIISFLILTWSLITSFSSTMPVVSLKSLIARLWFFVGFYILSAEIFRKQENIRRYFLAYLCGMIPVVFYFLVRMWQYGIFNQQMAYKAIRPFFNDHTSFGASLSFCIPLLIYFLASGKKSFIARAGWFLLLFLFMAAFMCSYSRAAWLSLFAAVLISFLMLFRISWKVVVPVIAGASIIIFVSFSDILIRLKENRQDSSDNFKRHLQSVSNIRSDASNVERLNRWNCAVKMFRERPFLGWGPATYQFKYAPFQIASEKTIISTNYGEGGNAHSEYLGSLVDSGLPGMILYIILLIVSFARGITVWKRHSEKQARYLSLALVAGLTTYVVHGALNNFLDTDKISALFWGMIAAIVALDLRMRKRNAGNSLSEISSDN